MPLISLKDFPGAATKDKGAFTRPIADAVRFLSANQMEVNENKRREQVQIQERMRQERVIDAREKVKLRKGQLARIYNSMQDDFDITTPHGREIALNHTKKAIALLGQSDANPESVQDFLDADNLDQMGVMLANAMMTAGQVEKQVDTAIGEQAPAGFKFVKDYPMGDGMFAAAYVPEVPGIGQIMVVGKPYEKSPLVEVNTAAEDNRFGKLSTDHRWIDPDNKALGQEPIPGTAADPGIKQERQYDDAITIVDKAEGSLDRYEALFDKHGTTVLPTAARQELGGAYAAMQLEIKELEKLGVLAGPDMALIERVLTDPLSIEGKMYEFFGGKEGFKSQMNLVRNKINTARASAERLYGKKQSDKAETKKKSLSDYTVDQLDAMSLEELEELEALQ